MNLGNIREVRTPLILTLDTCAIIGIFSSIYLIRLDELPDFRSLDLWIIATIFVFVLFITGTYFRERSTTLPALPIRTFFVCLVAGTICIIWVYLLGPSTFKEYFGRGVLPAGTILCGIATTLIRYFINRLYHRQERDAELLYLGFSASGQAFFDELSNRSEVRSVTVATHDPLKLRSDRIKHSTKKVLDLLQSRHWHSIIVDPSHHAGKNEKNSLVALRLTGTPVISLTDFYEKYWYMVPVQNIGDDWFLRSQGFSMLDNPISHRIKRILDVLLSFILLLTTTPLVLLCGLLVKLTSHGPMLFKQTRVGLRGKPFTIYKLRTMRDDAESNGAQWAQSDDPRITRFGKFLRQSRLDELPQCWNVLKGEMSFVGPRPERPEFTQELAEKIPYYELRHLVKPGITGWAQVIFPYGASVEDSLRKLQYELYYIKNQSLLLDLNIILRTLITVFQRAGR